MAEGWKKTFQKIASDAADPASGFLVRPRRKGWNWQAPSHQELHRASHAHRLHLSPRMLIGPNPQCLVDETLPHLFYAGEVNEHLGEGFETTHESLCLGPADEPHAEVEQSDDCAGPGELVVVVGERLEDVGKGARGRGIHLPPHPSTTLDVARSDNLVRSQVVHRPAQTG